MMEKMTSGQLIDLEDKYPGLNAILESYRS